MDLPALRPWALAVLTLGLFLLAAKFHGRQIRLEREQRGYMEVTFGSRANPEWVEALWSRDRRTFWPRVLLVVAVALLASALLGRGLLGTAGAGTRVLIGLETFAGAMTLAFVLNGIESWRRLSSTQAAGESTQGAQWMRRERWISIRLLTVTFALGVLVLLVAAA